MPTEKVEFKFVWGINSSNPERSIKQSHKSLKPLKKKKFFFSWFVWWFEHKVHFSKANVNNDWKKKSLKLGQKK